jgi:hypothetical protein
LTVNGDFNLDGAVDAADYVVWRNGLGTGYTQSDYGVWRAHFGASLGSGSGSAIPFAEPLFTAVPEPGSIVMLLAGALAIFLPLRLRRAFAAGCAVVTAVALATAIGASLATIGGAAAACGAATRWGWSGRCASQAGDDER